MCNSPAHYSSMHSPSVKPHRLIASLVEAGGGALQVAKAMGAPSFQGTLWKLANDQVKQPSRRTAERIAKFFDIPVDAVYDEAVAQQVFAERFKDGTTYWKDNQHPIEHPQVKEPVAQFLIHPTVYPALSESTARVPVVGTLIMGDNGKLILRTDPSGADFGSISGIGTDPGLFAIQVIGDHLYPMLRHGVCLVIEPEMPCIEGELAFIEFADGTCGVVELVAQRSDSITVLPVPSGARHTIDRSGISRLLSISGTVSASRFRKAK